MLTGNNGILTKAGDAKTQTDIAEEKEMLKMSVLSAISKEKYGDITKEKIDDELDENIGNANYSSELVDEGIQVTLKSNRTYIIDNNGNITEFTPIPLTGFSFGKTTLELEEEDSETLTIIKEPSNANEKIIWESSDETVATVDSKGNVTAVAVKSGQTTSTATIIAKNEAGTIVSANSCTVTVKKGYKNLVKNYRDSEEWELLYNGKVDPAGEERVYLIMKDALTAEELSIDEYGGTADFPTASSTEEARNTFNIKYPAIAGGLLYKMYNGTNATYTSTNENMKATQYLLDSTKWSDYLDYTDSTKTETRYGDYVIGGPTLELLVASYNAKQEESNKVTLTAPTGYGYERVLGNGTLPMNTDGSNPWNHGGSFWLAAPAKNLYYGQVSYYIKSDEEAMAGGYHKSNKLVTSNGTFYNPKRIRCVVCLKSGFTVEKSGSGWNIVAK